MNLELARSALFWGIISAVSLPLGALIGLLTKPRRRVTSALMAFGAGALLFALTIELFSEMLHYGREHGNDFVIVTIISAILGGLSFDLLNQLLNNRGAFLRSLSDTRKHLLKLKRITAKRLIKQLSAVRLLHALPPHEIAKLIPHMKREKFEAGDFIFHEGQMGSTLYFILSGRVDITRKNEGGEGSLISVLKENDTFGEMALLSHQPRNATAQAQTKTTVLKALQDDFDTLLSDSEELRKAVQSLFNARAENLSGRTTDKRAEEWKDECIKHLQKLRMPLTEREIDEGSKTASRAKGAALAIWLGILLDGIPESLIIGMLTASVTGMSLSFVTGVFMANLPEAMSSAVGMRKSGMSFLRILWMWGSLCLFTGLGAVFGVLLFPAHPTGTAFYWIAGIEGLAAGAMLTMIAETMLPEAFEQGGAIVGFSTLMGFLTALVVKMF